MGKLVLRENFDPVTVGVADEVESHVMVLIADATHGAVVRTPLVVVTGDTQAEVVLKVSEVVGFGTVTKPCELESEVRLSITEVDEDKRAIGCFFAAYLMEPEGSVVKVETTLQIKDVEVEVIEA